MADILNEQSRGGIIDGSKAHAALHKGETVLSPKEARVFAEVGTQTAETGNNIGSIFIKLNVDIADALTGLKALQREAKKAAQALRELETAQGKQPEISAEMAHLIFVNYGINPIELSSLPQKQIKEMAKLIYEKLELESRSGSTKAVSADEL